LARKITLNMYMTLAGYGEIPKYAGSDIQSKEPGKGFTDMWMNRYDLVDTILYSRRSYEGHLTYHSESARKASDPKYLFEFSRFLDRTQKIVLSHSLKKTDWQNSRIMKSLKHGELMLRYETVPIDDAEIAREWIRTSVMHLEQMRIHWTRSLSSPPPARDALPDSPDWLA